MANTQRQIDDEAKVPLKSYSGKELRRLYGDVSYDIWREWMIPLIDGLKELGYRDNQQVFTIKQVEYIFEKLGRP